MQYRLSARQRVFLTKITAPQPRRVYFCTHVQRSLGTAPDTVYSPLCARCRGHRVQASAALIPMHTWHCALYARSAATEYRPVQRSYQWILDTVHSHRAAAATEYRPVQHASPGTHINEYLTLALRIHRCYRDGHLCHKTCITRGAVGCIA